MNSTYLEFILTELKNAPKKIDVRFDPVIYNGSTSPYLGITNPEKYRIAKMFKKTFPDISFDEWISLLNVLNKGKSFEEKTIGPFLFGTYPQFVTMLIPKHFDRWLSNLTGWCEIDTLCQSTLDATQLLSSWEEWKTALDAFSKDERISARRASLVLLCRAISKNPDPRLMDLTLTIVQRLSHEKDKLITKAISWALRSLSDMRPQEVMEFINKNVDSLPKIAIRETKKKIATGKKS